MCRAAFDLIVLLICACSVVSFQVRGHARPRALSPLLHRQPPVFLHRASLRLSVVPEEQQQEEASEELLRSEVERFRALRTQRRESGRSDLLAKAVDAVNWVLVADVFVVFALMMLFLAGVVQKFATKDADTLLLDVLRRLWDPIVQPAIGLLMLGSLVSGAVSKIKEMSTKNS